MENDDTLSSFVSQRTERPTHREKHAKQTKRQHKEKKSDCTVGQIRVPDRFVRNDCVIVFVFNSVNHCHTPFSKGNGSVLLIPSSPW